MAESSNRVHGIKSPLPPKPNGDDPFLLLSMKFNDRISTPFQCTLELAAENFDADPNDLLGHSMTVKIRHDDRDQFFNGLVSRFWCLGKFGNYAHFHAELRPWFWFLKRNANCRIFQEASVTAIFEKVVKDTHGFIDFKDSLEETYKDREYCVQYRESDFNFLSRLLEEEGIFYYFEHEEKKHTLVLGDSESAYQDVEGESKIPYRPPGEAVDLEHVSQWHSRHEVRTGTYVLDDFDFTKPKVDLEQQSQVDRTHEQAKYEVYEYPGRYTETADGETLAKVRIQELQSHHRRLEGVADHRGFRSGHQFSLVEYPRESENGEYVLRGTEVEVESGEIEQMGQDRQNFFEVKFNAFPKEEPFRPARRTPKAVVRGPQTAIVVGKNGEEIWTDKYGRVKVQFHWDREGESDENSSCWIRVSQTWAGKNWGGVQIPRIGQEVIVDFLEGDPDRPLITGRVYNEDEMPPYDLPDHQTQSGVKSRSTKDGTAENFNELRFEDKKDEEEIYFHAEKNFTRIVENDDVLKIGFEKMDPGDQTIEVYHDLVSTIGNHRTAEIQKGDDSTTVSQGNHSLGVSAGESTVEAATKITLKVGASTITIEPASITIKSPQIKIQGEAQAEMKSPMTTIKGDAMAVVKGGVVMIN